MSVTLQNVNLISILPYLCEQVVVYADVLTILKVGAFQRVKCIFFDTTCICFVSSVLLYFWLLKNSL